MKSKNKNIEDCLGLNEQMGNRSEFSKDNGRGNGNEGIDKPHHEFDLDFINQYLSRPSHFNKPTYYDLPNGNYNMVVEDVWLGSSSQGVPLFHWKLSIVDHDEYEGIKISRFNTLKNEEPTMNRFIEDLSACGCKIQSADEIYTDEFKHQLRGIKILVEVCRKNGQIVYRFKKRQFNR